jgi:hypothetical protein
MSDAIRYVLENVIYPQQHGKQHQAGAELPVKHGKAFRPWDAQELTNQSDNVGQQPLEKQYHAAMTTLEQP